MKVKEREKQAIVNLFGNEPAELIKELKKELKAAKELPLKFVKWRDNAGLSNTWLGDVKLWWVNKEPYAIEELYEYWFKNIYKL